MSKMRLWLIFNAPWNPLLRLLAAPYIVVKDAQMDFITGGDVALAKRAASLSGSLRHDDESQARREDSYLH